MTEAKDNSSLPLLLSVTGAVVVVALGGWFLLNQEPAAPDTGTVQPADVPGSGTEAAVEQNEAGESPAAAAEITGTVVESEVTPGAPAEGYSLNIEAELRKARLAADAEILVRPATQSALYYYSRVIEIDPRHAIANAELDAILAKVAQEVTQHLSAEEYDDAYEIAVLVAQQDPEHSLVLETQTTLDSLTEDLVQQSINSAQDGDDEQADALLATALALPGRNPNYFNAIRESISEIRSVREAAENDRQQRAQLAADDARAAWVDQTGAAIAAGNLIAPAGASAKDLLAESNSWDAERTQLTASFLQALLDTARIEIANNQFAYAGNLLATATEMAGDPDEIALIGAELESAIIEEESNRVVTVSELVVVKTVPPRYPPRAQTRNVSGWVDVYFTVTPDGETANIEIVNSEPELTFDRAAVRAVEQWTFEPEEFRGQVISRRAGTRLVFVIE
jgi:protein TonB